MWILLNPPEGNWGGGGQPIGTQLLSGRRGKDTSMAAIARKNILKKEKEERLS